MSINKLNYEEWMVAFLDNELTTDELSSFNKFLNENLELKDELTAFKETKLSPDEAIIFDAKETLQNGASGLSAVKTILWSVVSMAIILTIFFFLNKESKHKLEGTTVNSEVLSHNALEKQLFTIDNNKEQTLITKKGTIIRVPKNAFKSNKNKIEVFVQEALNSEDIVLANLHTRSKKGILSSAGMVNINLADNQNASLQKPIEILVPRKSYNPKMNVYKGVKDTAGNITWVDPSPVLGKKKSAAFLQGETIYKQSCTSCHSIFGDKTGPALYNVQERRPRKWLHSFIRNSAKMIADNDPYAVCIYNEWGKVAQTSFMNLSDTELDNLLFYIKEQSATRPDLANKFPNPSSCDSCETYKKRMDEIRTALPKELAKLNRGYKEKVAQENFAFSKQEKIYLPNPIYPRGTSQTQVRYATPPKRDYFYAIQATGLGWYNIDILLKKLSTNSISVMASIANAEKKSQVSMLVPSLRVNVAGTITSAGTYTFGYGINTSLNIPKGEKCFIICVSGQNENRSLAIQSFDADKENMLSLILESMSKQEIIEKIKSLNLEQYELSPYSSDIVRQNEQLRRTQKEIRRKRAAEKAAIKKKRDEAYAVLKQKHKGNIEKINQEWQNKQAEIHDKYYQEILLAEHLKPLWCDCEQAVETLPTWATPAPAGGTVTDTSRGAPLEAISGTEINRVVEEVNTGTGADSNDYE